MNAFDLQAVLTMDSSAFDEALGRAGSALGGFAAAGAAAVTAAAGAVVGITTQAVEQYGQYEQMAGGIEKLFGDASDAVMENAANAFATSGRSANEYMEAVTAFSGSLIRDLEGDTERAAELSDLALRDMSDNVNTYGTSMEAVQNAYTGLMRGNFTMIDNLNLGFTGSAQGMADLVNASGILADGLTVDANTVKNLSFDQYIEAIHAVQTEMNISGISAEEAAQMVASGAMTEEEALRAMGTTAREATTTIQGSMAMTQSAWQNLITGLGDSDADLGSLIDNLVDSFMHLVDNITPVALNAMEGIADVITQLAPIIEANLPTMIETVLPALISAVTAIINAVVAVLPGLIETLLPPILQGTIHVVRSLIQALPTIINVLDDQIPVILEELVPAIIEVTPLIIDAGFQLLLALMEGFSENIDTIVSAITDMAVLMSTTILTPDNINLFIDATMDVIEAVAQALLDNAPIIIDALIVCLANIFIALVENYTQYFDESMEDAREFFAGFIAGVTEFGANVVSAFVTFLSNVVNTVVNNFEYIKTSISDAFSVITDWISDGIDGWINFFSDGFDNIWSTITSVLDNILGAFGNVFDDIAGVVSAGVQTLIDLFDFDWSLPDISLPHFSIQGGVAPYGLGGQGTFPSVSVEWYKKAYDQPMVLNDPTIFGFGGGKMLGAGDGNGGELIVGWDQLMSKISEASQPIIDVHVYIGNTELDDVIVDSKQRTDFIGGGRG